MALVILIGTYTIVGSPASRRAPRRAPACGTLLPGLHGTKQAQQKRVSGRACRLSDKFYQGFGGVSYKIY